MTREEQIKLIRAIRHNYNVFRILKSVGLEADHFDSNPNDVGSHLWASISGLSDLLEDSFELDKEKDEDFIIFLDDELDQGTKTPEEVYQMICLYQQIRCG